MTVNLESAFFTVSDRYLCVTIDSNAMRSHWAAIDLTTPIIVTLASGLSPLTLRVGGTSQDFAYFVPDSLKGKQDGAFPKEKAAIERKPKYYCKNGFRCINNVMDDNFTVSTQDWDVLNEFVKKVGWELLYGLNDYIMKDWESGVWDSSNAEELVKYTMEKGYTLLAWELGNGEECGLSVGSSEGAVVGVACTVVRRQWYSVGGVVRWAPYFSKPGPGSIYRACFSLSLFFSLLSSLLSFFFLPPFFILYFLLPLKVFF